MNDTMPDVERQQPNPDARFFSSRADWRVRSIMVWGLLLAAWVVTLRAVLSVSQLPGDWGHSVCGAWGCGPPLQAIVGCHGSWIVFLAAPAALIVQWATPRRVASVGKALLLLGALGCLLVAAYEAVTWLPQVEAWRRAYYLQRILFVVATLVEVPIFAAMAWGLALSVFGRARETRLKRSHPIVTASRDAAVAAKVLPASVKSGG